MNYWLMKSEPDVFSIDDLKTKTTSWDGVRNYQARNHMKNMKQDDLVFFYHSSCKNIGIAGIAKVITEAYPDHTSWEPSNHYFDPKSTPDPGPGPTPPPRHRKSWPPFSPQTARSPDSSARSI